MTKVVINDCFGGFSLTDQAFEKLLDRKGVAWEKQANKYDGMDYYDAGHLGDDEHYLSLYDYTNDARSDPDLIAVVEEMGKECWGQYAELKIVDVPEDVKWHIVEYDGHEHVAEDHRTWS